jgi:hypothetical protein
MDSWVPRRPGPEFRCLASRVSAAVQPWRSLRATKAVPSRIRMEVGWQVAAPRAQPHHAARMGRASRPGADPRRGLASTQ